MLILLLICWLHDVYSFWTRFFFLNWLRFDILCNYFSILVTSFQAHFALYIIFLNFFLASYIKDMYTYIRFRFQQSLERCYYSPQIIIFNGFLWTRNYLIYIWLKDLSVVLLFIAYFPALLLQYKLQIVQINFIYNRNKCQWIYYIFRFLYWIFCLMVHISGNWIF